MLFRTLGELKVVHSGMGLASPRFTSRILHTGALITKARLGIGTFGDDNPRP